jgi:hypothetical protein
MDQARATIEFTARHRPVWLLLFKLGRTLCRFAGRRVFQINVAGRGWEQVPLNIQVRAIQRDGGDNAR